MNDPLFKLKDDNFTFESHGVTIKVTRLNLPGYVAFRVSFSSTRQPITIARAIGTDVGKFWTAIPEGLQREKEAQGVGKLIEEYLNSKQ